MRTNLVEGVTVGSSDSGVERAIKTATKKVGSGNAMRFGVRNDEGVVYRVVTTTGLSELMAFTGNMVDAGFVDELEDAPGMVDGFDGIFRPHLG